MLNEQKEPRDANFVLHKCETENRQSKDLMPSLVHTNKEIKKASTNSKSSIALPQIPASDKKSKVVQELKIEHSVPVNCINQICV